MILAWLPGFRPDDGEVVLRTILTRYLRAYGPARPQHFARWLGIPPQRAVELFDERLASWSTSSWTVRRDGPWPATPARPGSPTEGSACFPTSTPTSSPVSLGSGCT